MKPLKIDSAKAPGLLTRWRIARRYRLINTRTLDTCGSLRTCDRDALPNLLKIASSLATQQACLQDMYGADISQRGTDMRSLLTERAVAYDVMADYFADRTIDDVAFPIGVRVELEALFAAGSTRQVAAALHRLGVRLENDVVCGALLQRAEYRVKSVKQAA